MKKTYTTPNINITELASSDIITSSSVANLANKLSDGKTVSKNYLFNLNS